MAPRISLALGVHNHQPVGNFGWVLAEVYEQAYRPMVEALERHPGVRMSLHYTGPLLDWLRRERPDFVARLRALVDRGQVELMGQRQPRKRESFRPGFIQGDPQVFDEVIHRE